MKGTLMGLFTPNWLTNEYDTADLTDNRKLMKACLQGKNPKVRLVAVRKVKDPETLKKIVLAAIQKPFSQMDSDDREVIIRACEKIRDEEDSRRILTDAVQSGHLSVCMDLFKNIPDEEILRLALDSKEEKVISNAMYCFRDKSILEQIIKNDTYDAGLKMMAVKAMNKEQMCRIADDPSNPEEYIDYAVGKCADNDLRWKIFRDERYSEAVRTHALSLTSRADGDFIRIVKDRNFPLKFRKAALYRIKDRDELRIIFSEADEDLKNNISPCRLFGHDYEMIGYRETSTGTKRDGTKIGRYRCRRCGDEYEAPYEWSTADSI